MNRVKFFLFTVIFIATALTFSCSKDKDEGDSGGGCEGDSIANYRTVKIGDQTWMAENLNCKINGSNCYGNNPANCAQYGRLYEWATAMALSANCNANSCASQINAKHRGICPSGWHIPSEDEWKTLTDLAGGEEIAGKYLKSTSGWNEGENGQDTHEFAAFPGGAGHFPGYFDGIGEIGNWWSTSEHKNSNAYIIRMYSNEERAHWRNDDKNNLYSVRCVQD
jgi:uncharacterized protein (TIGR02145 family)